MTDHAKASTLSPAAFAIVKAAHQADYASRLGIAAALRAAADQVVPQGGPFLMTASEDRVRHQLLAIAAELEGRQAEPPRRHVFPTPHQIAECGGPCADGGPEACDCGLYERSASKSTHLEIGDE